MKLLFLRTIAKKGSKEVRVRSTGAEKKRITVALPCTGDGKMLPALAIFKGKRQLKFSTPLAVKTTVQAKAWMDEDVMKRWFKGVIVPYTKGRKKPFSHGLFFCTRDRR